MEDEIKLAAVVVSVDYHGELAESLPRLVDVCDEVVVVTDVRDELTAEIATVIGARVLRSRNFQARGAVFNKAEAVHVGQKYIHDKYPESPSTFYLLVDSDIIVPEDLRDLIRRHCRDPLALYSMTRLDYHTPESWAAGVPDSEYKHFAAGYFQLYQRADLLYAPWSHDASKVDFRFRSRFTRVLPIPGAVAHLGRKRLNWAGRVAEEWVTVRETADDPTTPAAETDQSSQIIEPSEPVSEPEVAHDDPDRAKGSKPEEPDGNDQTEETDGA